MLLKVERMISRNKAETGSRVTQGPGASQLEPAPRVTSHPGLSEAQWVGWVLGARFSI